MLIDIKSISRSREAFIAIETEIGPDELVFSALDYRLVEPLVFQGQLQAAGDGVLTLVGRLTTVYEGICARCLVLVRNLLDVPVREVFRPVAMTDDGETEDSYRYEGFAVDIMPAIRDNLVLALPQRLICREECRGLCPDCGGNLNEQACHCADSGSGKGTAFDQLKSLL